LSEQNRTPVVLLPQVAHFSNKVDILDHSDRLEVDESKRAAENNEHFLKQENLERLFVITKFIKLCHDDDTEIMLL
jgi:hypothetical protein